MSAIRPGLCSVTFRSLTPAEIVGLVAHAGLEAIEWGGDVHVPPGDLRRAAEVARITAGAGLSVASYGSYFSCAEGESIQPMLDAAELLGTDRVRIWAGRIGSADASAEERRATVSRLRVAAAEAGARGMSLALEFHSGTLADDAGSTARLLDDVAESALSTYWQPTVGASEDHALEEYRCLSPWVSAVHVFSWWPRTERLPLAAREGLWRRVFGAMSADDAAPRDALLEFVPDDDPRSLAGEAAALRSFLA